MSTLSTWTGTLGVSASATPTEPPGWLPELNPSAGGLLLDLLIVVVTVALMRRGWRRGGLSALASLLGAAAGVIAASHLAAGTLESWAGASGAREFVGMTIALGLGGLAGYALGRTLGGVITRGCNPVEPPLLDRALGVATYGAAGLVICVLAVGVLAGGTDGIAGDSLLVTRLSDTTSSLVALPDVPQWSA